MHEPQDEEQDEAENGESLHGELQQGHGGRWGAAGPGVAEAPDQVDQPTDLGRASRCRTVREEGRARLAEAEDPASEWQRGASGASLCPELLSHGRRDQPRPGGADVRVKAENSRVCRSPDRSAGQLTRQGVRRRTRLAG